MNNSFARLIQNLLSRRPFAGVHPVRIAIASLAGTLLLTIAIFTAYELAFFNRYYPGIAISGIVVSGLTRAEARILLEQAIKVTYALPFEFIVSGKLYQLKPTDLGLVYDSEAALFDALHFGRNPEKLPFGQAALRQFFVKRYTFTQGVNFPTHFTLNLDQTTTYLTKLIEQTSIPAHSASYEASGAAIIITKERAGHSPDLTSLLTALKTDAGSLTRNPHGIPMVSLEPTYTESTLTPWLPKVSTVAANPPTFINGNKTFTPSQAEIAAWFSPQGSTQSANFSLSETLDLATTSQPKETGVPLAYAAIQNYITNLAASIDQPAFDALFRMEGNKVAAFRPSQDGQTLNQPETLKKIIAYLVSDNPSSKTIELPIKLTRPTVQMESINDLGIKELLGRGVSVFAGSISGRIHNIKLSASRISGVILKPEEEFSFNASVGDVSKETGFQPAYVIENGRTVLGDGGGVCQTSTTLFRAVLNSGLPITERQPHAYRVGYYEQNSPPGFDATVFSPSVDFKFKNDTPAHILIQTIFDPGSATLTTEIYGTSDGRTTTLTKPTITNQIPPPPARYQEDHGLPKGTTKQVDWSAWGANVSFQRKVTKKGKVLYDSTFSSIYRPWQAVFLVGIQ